MFRVKINNLRVLMNTIKLSESRGGSHCEHILYMVANTCKNLAVINIYECHTEKTSVLFQHTKMC